MRILLAALTCAKGDLVANAEQHERVLAEAHDAGCTLAVFPEMSLTGSVDPIAHPHRAIALDDPTVDRIAAATRATGVDALFGIGERTGDGFVITQVHVTGGAIAGVQRKRVLGADELGFTASFTTERFVASDVPLGVIICAETTDPTTWDATAATGAPLILVTAAPGLHGRRTDDAGWRAGFEWWTSAGIADARRNAARLGVWVALTTQAGSTEDEDFPGGAALIGPTGSVVAALPDHCAGTLVVEVPVTGAASR